jgi:hypothetical protein
VEAERGGAGEELEAGEEVEVVARGMLLNQELNQE